jgi:hypothetical protein
MRKYSDGPGPRRVYTEYGEGRLRAPGAPSDSRGRVEQTDRLFPSRQFAKRGQPLADGGDDAAACG